MFIKHHRVSFSYYSTVCVVNKGIVFKTRFLRVLSVHVAPSSYLTCRQTMNCLSAKIDTPETFYVYVFLHTSYPVILTLVCVCPATVVIIISSSHHLIISSSHHLIISSSHHLIISSSHHLIISSSHHLIISSSHHLIISSSHHLIISSSHHLIISSSHHLIISSSHLIIKLVA